MNIRAYKLAEELGIDKDEFVEKAKVLGIELRSAMAAVEPDQAERLRAKLGVASGRRSVQESRVERKGTSTVIRRRRTVTAEPEPEEEEEEVSSAFSKYIFDNFLKKIKFLRKIKNLILLYWLQLQIIDMV